jgi:hypothetical protein
VRKEMGATALPDMHHKARTRLVRLAQGAPVTRMRSLQPTQETDQGPAHRTRVVNKRPGAIGVVLGGAALFFQTRQRGQPNMRQNGLPTGLRSRLPNAQSSLP